MKPLITFFIAITVPLFSLAEFHSFGNNGNYGFRENVGQIVNSNKEQALEVLFYTEFEGTNIYLTEKGITLLFLKQSENEGTHTLAELDFALDPSRISKKVAWEHIDIVLEGASISKDGCRKLFPNENNLLNFFNPSFPDGVYGVKEYGKIVFKDVYPNIDWEIYPSSKNGYKYGHRWEQKDIFRDCYS